jgi:hypothetical protein
MRSVSSDDASNVDVGVGRADDDDSRVRDGAVESLSRSKVHDVRVIGSADLGQSGSAV